VNVNTNLERAQTLRQALLDFVLDAEDDLASALEAFIAEQLKTLSNGLFRDNAQVDAAVETFAMQGTAAGRPVLEWFLESEGPFSESDLALVKSWSKSFVGLFAVQSVADEYDLRNWLTAKTYIVKASQDRAELDALKRVSAGEIILTRILPLNQDQWMFSGPKVLLGKLGKPKLAVAIGNFKTHHKSELYADAPELLEAAWLSVEQGHQSFVDFFGSDEITLPGHQLSKRLTDYQTAATQSHLKAAGIEEGTSLQDLADQAGLDTEEIAESLPAGLSEKVVTQALEKATAPNMVMPPVEVPAHLKQAESVTVLAHPRWGQVFIPEYESIQTLLENETVEPTPDEDRKLHQLLENSEAKFFVWQRLAQQYPTQLERILRRVLDRPNFKIEQDLETVLQSFNQPPAPELPETASVPQHLHDLFQEAFSEVNRSQSKDRSKSHSSKKTGGFGRR
jgi:hypothetical protein